MASLAAALKEEISTLARREVRRHERALEQEMTPAWFPAWMLIEEPELAGVLAPRQTRLTK